MMHTMRPISIHQYYIFYINNKFVRIMSHKLHSIRRQYELQLLLYIVSITTHRNLQQYAWKHIHPRQYLNPGNLLQHPLYTCRIYTNMYTYYMHQLFTADDIQYYILHNGEKTSSVEKLEHVNIKFNKKLPSQVIVFIGIFVI